MEKFENKELAEFLEDSARGLFDLNPNAACVVGINDDVGIAGTNYLTNSIDDKARLMHQIFSDLVMDIVLSNIHLVRESLDDTEGEDIDGEEDIEQ